ncbi:Zn-ribbon domain-containing OB-fold protein [Nocardia sp. NPDC004151]|uniref:Zn-ribbon domain-containing OB-fold protein n=1 Tax=Nocardia sp. NPDC004151 TaxID=3364304 RepID=UPI00367842AD
MLDRVHQHRSAEVSMIPSKARLPQDGTVDSACAPVDTLMIRRCTACDKIFAPLTTACSVCAADDLESVPASGAGSIVSWRMMYRASGPSGETAPLATAIVELDEGPWIHTAIEGDLPLISNASTRVHFQPSPRPDRLPVFTVDVDPRHPAFWSVSPARVSG